MRIFRPPIPCNFLGHESSSQAAWRRCLQVISITFAWRVNRFNEKDMVDCFACNRIRTSREELRKVRAAMAVAQKFIY
jgi:hypothetical protein